MSRQSETTSLDAAPFSRQRARAVPRAARRRHADSRVARDLRVRGRRVPRRAPVAGRAAAPRGGALDLRRDGQRLHGDAQRDVVPPVRPRAVVQADRGRARADIERVFEIWHEKLERVGRPVPVRPVLDRRRDVLSRADALSAPTASSCRARSSPYAEALEAQPAVRALIAVASSAPRIPVYDDYLRRFGGDPDAALRSKNEAALARGLGLLNRTGACETVEVRACAVRWLSLAAGRPPSRSGTPAGSTTRRH